MSEKKEWNWKLLVFNFIEIIIVIAIAFVLDLFDDSFTYENKRIGLLVGIIGTLIIVSRIIANEVYKENVREYDKKTSTEKDLYQNEVLNKLSNSQRQISKISKVIDLKEETKVESVKKLLDVYLNITEKEFSQVKDTIITEAISSLNKLKNNKRSDELAASDYYEWLLPILENVGNGQKIKAVSCMFDTEWDDSPAETRFINGNVNAAKKGAFVERIFLMDIGLLEESLKITAIQYHAKNNSEKNLQGFVSDREKVKTQEPSLLEKIGHGFIIFDSRVALIDQFDESGHVRGIVTMNEKDIRDLENAFKKLKFYSKILQLPE
jgi:hypothetical protein